jgi:hypothetical protein
MFTQMAQHQADVVDALLSTIPGDDWTHAYVHTEFNNDPAFPIHMEEGFLAIREDGRPKQVGLLVSPEVGRALELMHEAYAAAGHGFSRADLLVHASGAYRFDLDARPSAILEGQPDPEAKSRLDRRFERLVREEEL